jgi:glycine/D-amino acid oxidase-like deaminating enzyme
MPQALAQSDAPSAWLADLAPPEPAPALEGERRVDVAVVGAGYTGLGAALALRAEGARVAVIERETAGFGASGRNAGFLTPGIGKDLPALLRAHGRERTRALLDVAEAAVAYVERLIAGHAIDCGYRPTGNVKAAVHESQLRWLEREAREARELGCDADWLDPPAMRKRGLPRAFLAGILERRGGTLDPARYARGLRRAALEAGVELYEHTPLVSLEEGRELVLVTPRGWVRAERAVLATNAYTHELGRLGSLAAPLWATVGRTRRLTRAERSALEWPGGEGIYTGHQMLEILRLTDDDRLLVSGKSVHYGFAGRSPRREPAAACALLARALRDRLPELDVALESLWGGPAAFTLDMLPALGATGRHGNLLYAIGYAGHGVHLASFAGRMLADWMAGRQGPGRVLLERRHASLPPEPLRWLALRGASALLRWSDARVDRAARRAGLMSRAARDDPAGGA